MGRRAHYPEEIDRKYERQEDRDNPTRRDTDESLKAAEIVAEEWKATFSSIAKLDTHDLSRSTIQRAWSHYFGPVDDDRTFYEIEEEFGSTDEYYKLKKEGKLDEEDEEQEEQETKENNKKSHWKDNTQAYQEGFQAGWEAREQSLYRGLPSHILDEIHEHKRLANSTQAEFEELFDESG